MPRGNNRSSDPGPGRYNFGVGRNGNTFSLAQVDSDLFVSAIGAVLSNGDAVLFSLTSDGGALAIKIYSDAGKQNVYCADQAELDLVLNTLKASSLD